MKEITKNELEGFPIEKITKFLFNKTLESETLVEGVIINKDKCKQGNYPKVNIASLNGHWSDI